MQKQLSDLFGAERSVITKHINNIFKSLELEKNAVCAKFAHTASDGKNNKEQATIYKKKIKKNQGLSPVSTDNLFLQTANCKLSTANCKLFVFVPYQTSIDTNTAHMYLSIRCLFHKDS
jgi:hypothetical protein